MSAKTSKKRRGAGTLALTLVTLVVLTGVALVVAETSWRDVRTEAFQTHRQHLYYMAWSAANAVLEEIKHTPDLQTVRSVDVKNVLNYGGNLLAVSVDVKTGYIHVTATVSDDNTHASVSGRLQSSTSVASRDIIWVEGEK